MRTYSPLAGTHIDKACEEAVAQARALDEPVRFTFNGIALQALPSDQPETIRQRWTTIQAEQHTAYRNSREGKAAQARREATITRRQRETDSAIDALPKILRTDNHLDALMNWLRAFVTSADDVAVRWDQGAVVDRLILAGYHENENVGQKPEWFNTRERMGRYIIGQAINCIAHAMPPHPITIRFVEKYFALPNATTHSSRERVEAPPAA